MSVSSKIRPGAPSPRGGGIAVRQFSLRRREELRPHKYTASYGVLWLSHFFDLVDQDGSTEGKIHGNAAPKELLSWRFGSGWEGGN